MSVRVAAGGLLSLIARRYCGPFWIRRRQLAHTQWLDRQRLDELQFNLLRRLLRHCYATVPYYRQQMEEMGVQPDDVKCLEDIRRFPVLTKQDVLDAHDSLISSKYPHGLRHTAYTGGTTGTPLALERDLFSIANEHAFVRRQWDWAGIGLRDRTAYLSGRVVVDPAQTEGPFHMYDPFMRELILSTYHLSEATAGQYAEAIVRYRIRAIVGYPSPIAFLAKVCRASGLKIRLRAVLTTSETLTEVMRENMTSAFDCRVFDFYGAAERVCYIHTCDHGSYHLIPEYGYTEFVPLEHSISGECRVIATGFWNRAMPLIRYDLGDVIVPSDRRCECGRAFPVVESIAGRTGDVVRTSSGRQLGPTLMARVTKGAKNVLEMQIIQDRLDHIILRYVPSSKFTDEDLAHFKAHVAHHMPLELEIAYERTDRIDRTRSGKMKFIVSKM